MDLEDQLKLSYYKEIGAVDRRGRARLVQHVETGRVYVEKVLTLYDRQVYTWLMDHPSSHIPRIRELVEDGGKLWVVEEYISGDSLRAVLEERGTLPPEEAVDILRQLCRTLAPLHRHEPPIVHRDIKPENLILTGDGRVVLVDFDAARESAGDKGQDTVLMGTSGYAAPEQYGFSASRATADIYALGVLLNELITGKMPGEERCGGRLGRVVENCCRMDPASRYPTVEALGRSLETALPWARGAWALPGFRTGYRTRWLAAGLWYALILVFSATVELTGYRGLSLLCSRVTVFLLFFLETLWLGNYRDTWSTLPLTRSRRLPLRLLGIVLWGSGLLISVAGLGVALSELLL